MYIYAFGSICRGEVDIYSDIDLLAITNEFEQFNEFSYSRYTQQTMKNLWERGNPFAWHLFWEAKLIFSSDNNDFLKRLNKPSKYKYCLVDCLKFQLIFKEASHSLKGKKNCAIYDLGMVFLAIRNIASCYSLGVYEKPNFSRSSAFNLGNMSIPISLDDYHVLERARILASRGQGDILSHKDIKKVLKSLSIIDAWVNNLISTIENNITCLN